MCVLKASATIQDVTTQTRGWLVARGLLTVLLVLLLEANMPPRALCWGCRQVLNEEHVLKSKSCKDFDERVYLPLNKCNDLDEYWASLLHV